MNAPRGCLFLFQLAVTGFSSLVAAGAITALSSAPGTERMGVFLLLAIAIFPAVTALAAAPLLLAGAGCVLTGTFRSCSRCDWLQAGVAKLPVRKPRWRSTLALYRRTGHLAALATLFLLAVSIYQCERSPRVSWSAPLFWLLLAFLPPHSFCRSRLAAALEPPPDEN